MLQKSEELLQFAQSQKKDPKMKWKKFLKKPIDKHNTDTSTSTSKKIPADEGWGGDPKPVLTTAMKSFSWNTSGL